MLKFILNGIQSGEKTCYFSEKIENQIIIDFFRKFNVSYDKKCNEGRFGLSSTEDVYFRDDNFDPESMIELLSNFYKDSVEHWCTGARVIGDMPMYPIIPANIAIVMKLLSNFVLIFISLNQFIFRIFS